MEERLFKIQELSTVGWEDVVEDDNSNRKLKYTLEIIEDKNSKVGVNTHSTNKIVHHALQNNLIDEFNNISEIKTEIKFGLNTRFDFLVSNKKHKAFIVDAALIYESGADTHMDYVIVVTSLLRFRTQRVMTRGNISRDDFMKRVALQWSDEDKEHMADFTIQNNSDLKGLEKESKKIFNSIL